MVDKYSMMEFHRERKGKNMIYYNHWLGTNFGHNEIMQEAEIKE